MQADVDENERRPNHPTPSRMFASTSEFKKDNILSFATTPKPYFVLFQTEEKQSKSGGGLGTSGIRDRDAGRVCRSDRKLSLWRLGNKKGAEARSDTQTSALSRSCSFDTLRLHAVLPEFLQHRCNKPCRVVKSTFACMNQQ